MKIAASVPSDLASAHVEILKGENIYCEFQVVTDENGLESTAISVRDEDFDKACDLIENWEAEKAKVKTKRCPKCGSQDWEQVQDEHYEKVDLVVLRCKNCGTMMPV